ncbi:MAG: AAA family ATPase [Steroidobacteraceae bacterium]
MNAAIDETLLWLHRDRADVLARAAQAFLETRDPGAARLTAGQSRAVDELVALANDGNAGAGLLTAPAGLGKTLVRTAVRQRLAPERCATVVVESCLLDFDDLLLEILSQLRGERIASARLPGRYERIAEFKATLVADVVAGGRHLVLLLDDAERADAGTLDAIGALMNLSSDRQAYVVPILIGQPSLRQTLGRLPVLRQRIGAQFTLAPLDAIDTGAYIEARLEARGLDSSRVLDPALPARLHEASGGVPRTLNACCRHALLHAARRGSGVATTTDLDAARRAMPEAGPDATHLMLGH